MTSQASVLSRVLVVVAVGLLVGAALVAMVSFGGTSDTPCGSLLRRNFGFEGHCGRYYRFEIAAIGALVGLSLASAFGAVVVHRHAQERETGDRSPAS